MSSTKLSVAANAVRIEAIRQAVSALPKHIALGHASFVEAAIQDESSTASEVTAYIGAVERDRDAKAGRRAAVQNVVTPAPSQARERTAAQVLAARAAAAKLEVPPPQASFPVPPVAPMSAEAVRLSGIADLQRTIALTGHDDLFIEARAHATMTAGDIALRIVARERNNVPAAALRKTPIDAQYTRSDLVRLALHNWELSKEIRTAHAGNRADYVEAIAGRSPS